ncbi:GCN5 family acetyltransferase [Corynebacterium casei]|uniref:GCN5 family acetyltransferase n=1 Tax=Corynebacterium casei TaxID=160386 RepID=UPI003F90935A
MQQFELRILPQVEDFVTPFKRNSGFERTWWHSRAGYVGSDPFSDKDYIQFLIDETEVGRAEVTDWVLTDTYVGVHSEIAAKQITFFEIHQDNRRKGYGTEFISYLIAHYSELPLAAFSENADEFWAGIGWHHFPRRDGEGQPYIRNLYVSGPAGGDPISS